MALTYNDDRMQRESAVRLMSPARTIDWLTDGDIRAYPHVRKVGNDAAEAALDPRIVAHLIYLQNQVGKSTTVSGVATWLLEHFPNLPILIGSHSQELARKMSREVRNNFLSEKLTTTVTADSKAAHRWHTDAGGSIVAVGVGGGVGWPATVAILDDLLKNWNEAQNPTTRERTWAWVMADVFGRLRRRKIRMADGTTSWISPTIIMPATRYHEDDPSGRMIQLLDEDQIKITHIPALADPTVVDPDPLGREPGEPVCVDFFTRDEMERRREIVDPIIWATMYQGTPKNLEGGTIPRKDWVWAEAAPRPEDRIVTFTSWDLTFGQSGSSWVVGQLWCATQSNKAAEQWELTLLDQVRRKLDWIGQRKLIREYAAAHPEATFHLIEKAANGHAMLSELGSVWIEVPEHQSEEQRTQRDLYGNNFRRWEPLLGVVPIVAQGSKLERALRIRPFVTDGRVRLPSWWQPKAARWIGDPGDDPAHAFPQTLINECAEVPNAATDDELDACTQAVWWAATELSNIMGIDADGGESTWRPRSTRR